MKFLVALCLFAVAIYSVQSKMTPEMTQKYETMRDECIEKTGTTMEMVLDTRNNIFADDDKLASYMRCMFEKSGFMDHDGTMHMDAIMKVVKHTMTETEAKEVLDTCMMKMKDMTNLEKKCYGMVKCFRTATGHMMH